jgi:hypothetical protein
VDWLDAQDPEVLEKLRGLDVGEAPQGGWMQFLAKPVAPAAPPADKPAKKSAEKR